MFPQSASEQQQFTLQLSQLFPAKKERVFHAWTNKDALEKWFGPEGMSTTVLELEVEVGGKYHFKIDEKNGNHPNVFGKYLEIVPNEKLVFTWRWEDWEAGLSDSLVTVEFREKGGFTEVMVTHSQLANEQMVEGHKFGWSGALNLNLVKYFTESDVTEMKVLKCKCGFEAKGENKYEAEAKIWHHGLQEHSEMLKGKTVEELEEWLRNKDAALA